MRYRFLRFPEGRTKAVTLSYDDGCKEDVRFSEIITEYGLKCTFNINGEIRGEKALTCEQLHEYYLDRGHEVALHGNFHRAEGALRPIEAVREVLDNRLYLEKKLGMIIRGMAYPDSGITKLYGEITYEQIRDILKQLDVAYCRTLGGDNEAFMLPTDWHAWMPTAHHSNPKVLKFIDSFLSLDPDGARSTNRAPRLFYLWGHSFEFERNNNWNLLYTICEKLSKKDDVWYATNMEIYEYVTAYRSLIYSADNKIIYNPTLIKIWFDIDGTLYSIDPGQTITVDAE